MKYVVLQITSEDGSLVREMPFICPEHIIHADFAAALQKMPGFEKAVVVSAGHISSMDLGCSGSETMCHGESSTLKVKSRGAVDDTLMNGHDYFHGLVT